MNFCPCLQNLVSKFKGKKSKSSYEGPRQFEEEEFMNPHHEDISLSDAIAPQHKPASYNKRPIVASKAKPIVVESTLVPSFEQEKESQTQILNIKMQIPNTIMEAQPTVIIEPKEEKSIEQLIEAELLITPEQVVKQNAVEREEIKQYHSDQVEENEEKPVFTVNLDPLDPHFALIHEKAQLVPELLRKEGQRLQVGAPNKTGLEIILLENSRSSNFLLRYTLPCSYSYYLSILRAEKAITAMSGLLAQAKTLESYRPNLTLNTLKFKRMGGLQARDCFYVKYQNGGKFHHWQLYLNDESAPRSAEYKNCQIFCCKSLKQVGERQLRVTEYVEVDLGASNLSSVVAKLAGEVRNFLNSLSDHINNNYEQEMA